MRTCFNTATSGQYPLKDTIEYLGRYHYEGIEIDDARLQEYLAERSLDDLRAQLARNHVEVAALMAFPFKAFGERAQIVANVGKHAEMAKALGAPVLLYFAADQPPEGMSREEALERAAASAAEYGDGAAPFGVKIALEPIGGLRFMGGPKDALAIAAKSGRPNVGIMMDTFHYFKSNIPLEEIRAIPVEKLLIVHINDSPDLPRGELNDSHRVYCGEGAIPLVEELRALKRMGYGGFLSVEIFNRDYWADTHENIVRKSKETLDRVLAQV